MTPDLKAKWTTALRSGQYKQGQGDLYNRTLHTFCCLGVLCKVAGVDPYEGGVNDGGILSTKGKRDVGLDDYQHDTLYNMNDGTGDAEREYTFPEIADWIDKNVV